MKKKELKIRKKPKKIIYQTKKKDLILFEEDYEKEDRGHQYFLNNI